MDYIATQCSDRVRVNVHAILVFGPGHKWSIGNVSLKGEQEGPSFLSQVVSIGFGPVQFSQGHLSWLVFQIIRMRLKAHLLFLFLGGIAVVVVAP